MKHQLLAFAVLLLGSRASAADAQQQHPLLQDGPSRESHPRVVSPGLDAYIEGLMEQWHVPGLAIAIVDGDKTWAKGYGYAALNSTPVTPHTLFSTGSTTKSFVAAGLSLLIDNATANSSAYSGLTWKTPVSSVLRDDFVLSDDWATAHVTLEDALSHRTGYPRHDLATAATPRDTVRLLRHLPLAAEPRTAYLYCNKMFVTMGHLISVLTGKWLGDFFREHLWRPMGMDETYFSLADAESSGLVLAVEYYYDPSSGKHFEVPHEPSSGEEGAGGIISTVLDYAKYLRVMIDESAPLSKAGHREVKTPRNFVAPFQAPYVGAPTYALGWGAAVFEGEQVYSHSGQVTMFRSTMRIVPSRRLGVAVFINTDADVPEILAHHVLSEHLGVPEDKRYDLNKRLLSERKQGLEYLQNCAKSLYPSLPDPPYLPSLPVPEHVGEFFDPGYGTLRVDLNCSELVENCKLRILGVGGDVHAYLGPAVYLEPMSGNSWLGRIAYGAGLVEKVAVIYECVPVEFRIDVQGKVSHVGVGVRLEDGRPLTWFERV